MAVLLETSLGEIVLDLFVDDAPFTCCNFLGLCHMKYYHHCTFFNVTRDFIAQTGDPTNTGRGGVSAFSLVAQKEEGALPSHESSNDSRRCFRDEISPTAKHNKRGLVAMANAGVPNSNASSFYFTLTDNHLPSLDGKHTIFASVAEGLDVLERINEAYVDDNKRPYQHIRIQHTHVLDDPFANAADDPELAENLPPALVAFARNYAPLAPPASPELVRDPTDTRLEASWQPAGEDGGGSDDPDDDPQAAEERARAAAAKEARARAEVLEMVGDLPDADVKPPEEMLFVCKLNSVTSDEDLEIIFSRFGKVTSCSVVRDNRTGESLNYAFVGFETKQSAEAAYFKMNDAVIDDRRIKVDFSQSVSHLWKKFRTRKTTADDGWRSDAWGGGGGGGGGGRGKSATRPPSPPHRSGARERSRSPVRRR